MASVSPHALLIDACARRSYACNWGEESPWIWGPQAANLFRNTPDIAPGGGPARWSSVLANFDATVAHSGTPPAAPGLPGTGIGAWNDPDMLCVGMPGLSDVEGRSHFTLWTILAVRARGGQWRAAARVS